MTQNTDLSELKAGLEAILMICENPVDVATLATVFDISGDEVFTALDQLAAEYRGEGGEGALFSRPRGFELREVGGASTLPRVSKSWFPASSLWELREGSPRLPWKPWRWWPTVNPAPARKLPRCAG